MCPCRVPRPHEGSRLTREDADFVGDTEPLLTVHKSANGGGTRELTLGYREEIPDGRDLVAFCVRKVSANQPFGSSSNGGIS
jgi:hypothetical protein